MFSDGKIRAYREKADIARPAVSAYIYFPMRIIPRQEAYPIYADT